MMIADQIVTDFCHDIGKVIGFGPLKEIDVVADVCSVEANCFSREPLKLKMIAGRFDETIFPGGRIKQPGKIKNGTVFDRPDVPDDPPLIVCSRHDRFFLGWRDFDGRKGDPCDQPAYGTVSSFKRDLFQSFLFNGEAGYIQADWRTGIVALITDIRIRTRLWKPVTADIMMCVYFDSIMGPVFVENPYSPGLF